MIRVLLLLAFLIPLLSLGQPASQKMRRTINAVYVEAFGSSFLFYNIAYDRILGQSEKMMVSGSFGMQYNFIGSSFGEFDLSISPGLNLIFKGKHLSHFELGAGVAIFPQLEDKFYIPIRIGYRRQDLIASRAFFKIAITPVLIIGNTNFETGVLPMAGIAYGFGF